MPRRKQVILGSLLVGILVALVGALQGTEFRGGRPWPSLELEGLPAPLPPSTLLPARWLGDLVRLVLFLGVIFGGMALVFSKKFRRHALYLLFTLAMFILAWSFLARLPLFQAEPGATPPAPGGPAAGGPGAGEGPPQAPGWAIPLAAVAVGMGTAVWLGSRLFSALEKKRARKKVEEIARETAEELRRGVPVADAVVRAWLRMVEVLSARAGVQDRPALTPREFAENLAQLGFRHEAVDRLTQLFEEVRYGHKDSASRRDQALAALAALERAYAKG